MLSDLCKCGIKPTNHRHIINSGDKDDILWLKGAPIIQELPMENKFYFINSKELKTFPTRRKGKSKNIKSV